MNLITLYFFEWFVLPYAALLFLVYVAQRVGDALRGPL